MFFGGLDIWAWNNGGEWVDSHNNPTLNAPANVATLTWMKGWADRYGGKSKLDAMQSTFGSQGPTDGFMSGKVSMVVDIQGYQRFLNIYKPFNAGVASITPAPGHKPASTSGGFAVAMPTSRGRDAATRAAAWEFMKYLSLVGQASWAANTYGMPTVESIAKTNSTLAASPHWTEFVSAMSYGRAGVYNPYYPTMMGDLVTPAQDAGLSGKYSPKQALTVAQNQAINEINRNRR